MQGRSRPAKHYSNGASLPLAGQEQSHVLTAVVRSSSEYSKGHEMTQFHGHIVLSQLPISHSAYTSKDREFAFGQQFKVMGSYEIKPSGEAFLREKSWPMSDAPSLRL